MWKKTVRIMLRQARKDKKNKKSDEKTKSYKKTISNKSTRLEVVTVVVQEKNEVEVKEDNQNNNKIGKKDKEK